jgi:hypothetical protein
MILESIALDAAVSLGSMVVAPAFDFIKKKFLKSDQDTPERTISTLATTKPEILPDYVKAESDLMEAKGKFFNRDVIGTPSQWVIDLRASIRPIVVVLSFVLFFLNGFTWFILDRGIILFCESAIGSWMGSRLVKK